MEAETYNQLGQKVSNTLRILLARKKIELDKYNDLILKSYTSYRYIPIMKYEDIIYSGRLLHYLLDDSSRCITEDFASLLREFGVDLELNPYNPWDRIRLFLDSTITVCLYGLRHSFEVTTIYYRMPMRCGKKEVVLPLHSFCEVLRKIDRLVMTFTRFIYIAEIWGFVDPIQRSCLDENISSPRAFIEKYTVGTSSLEALRRYMTKYVLPPMKNLLGITGLLRYNYSLPDFYGSFAKYGINVRKDLVITYLGDITSEILDAMMYSYWSPSVVKVYDTLTKSYFNILKSLAESAENGEEYDYIEKHFAFNEFFETINKILPETDPFTYTYLQRRGLLRTGVIIKDVSSFLASLRYHYELFLRENHQRLSRISEYSIDRILINYSLNRKLPR